MFPREYLPTQGRDDSSSTEGVFQYAVLYYTILYKTFRMITAISSQIKLFGILHFGALLLLILLEFAEGIELFDKIIDKTKLNKDKTKLHFYQMVSAIQYLHSKNICYRDLKPENVLLCSADNCKLIVKITDMGPIQTS